MDLTKLFEMQRKLDDHIYQEHPELKDQNNLDWKILALQVELGECANEWRGFKKWSYDQEPRTEVYFGPLEIPEVGTYKNPLLEEYVDCLHFILSIGLELNTRNIVVDSDYTRDTITKTFNELFRAVAELEVRADSGDDYSDIREMYEILLNTFVGLGEMLGFEWRKVEQAYFEKNVINHERQESGY